MGEGEIRVDRKGVMGVTAFEPGIEVFCRDHGSIGELDESIFANAFTGSRVPYQQDVSALFCGLLDDAHSILLADDLIDDARRDLEVFGGLEFEGHSTTISWAIVYKDCELMCRAIGDFSPV